MSTNAQQASPKKKADLKVVILGNASVGKTCLIQRYLTGHFQEVTSTIGASFALRQWGNYNAAIWDTAGEERFAGLSSFYCRGAGAAILAYDITNDDTFYALRARFLPLLHCVEDNCLKVVVATKTDLLSEHERKVKPEEGMLFARELNKDQTSEVPFFETSSVTGQNVVRVFDYIFGVCLDDSRMQSKTKRHNTSVVDLQTPSKGNIPHGDERKGCC